MGGYFSVKQTPKVSVFYAFKKVLVTMVIQLVNNCLHSVG